MRDWWICRIGRSAGGTSCAPGMGDALNCLHPGSLPVRGGVMKAGALLVPSSMFALSRPAPFCWRSGGFWPLLRLAYRPYPGPSPVWGEGTGRGIALVSFALSLWGRGAGLGRFALILALSPLRERVLGGSCDPRPVYSWFLPLSREMSLPCKAVTPVLASRMPTSIARRHWGCSPSSNFPGRLTAPCGTACVSRLDLPPAKASGCAGYGPPGRPRVRTWNGGDAFGTASS